MDVRFLLKCNKNPKVRHCGRYKINNEIKFEAVTSKLGIGI